ncbi:MAG: acyltransferase [Myxacorys californica WJT36-NPBG1]|jgi:peptidoglycan/LPS O-acetylase OafA/YrhL|nr:acyltransferase [Myxacorys californica WJT36-NPBG1]
MNQPEPSIQKNSANRLLGIDWCRGLAAYAVVLVHSGDETWGVPISQEAIAFRLLFYFAVPFFLATAFYFLTRKSAINLSSKFWKSRIHRIVVPYIVWSVIYLIVRSFFFIAAHKSDRLAELFQDPLGLVFFGRASYQLYFLPLLLAGTSLLLVAKYLLDRKINLLGLTVIAVAGIAVNQLIYATGNGFQLGEGIAFASILKWIPSGIGYTIARVILVEMVWVIWCVPYLFTALILHRLLATPKISRLQPQPLAILFLVLFILTATFGKVWLFHSLQEVLVAYSLLLLGIFGSHYFKKSKLAANLGACSFGIYLIHPIPMNIVKVLLAKVFPSLTQQVSIASMLTFSISSFLLSWLIVSLLSRHKSLAQYAFGA